jgi:GDPmannose 4,6-dehydratase
MLQQDTPDDYVLATGVTVPVRQFVEWTFAEVGIEIEWRGEGVDEVGIDKATGRIIVLVDPRYFRPTEVDLLIGDPTKAREKLGWQPSITVQELAKEMVAADLKVMRTATIGKGV